ncbi:hypothetical protein CDV51_13890 [Haematobacter massiliensis]|nr:hypothetical protein CDV51_13890 [Haematobacter massiliensis]
MRSRFSRLTSSDISPRLGVKQVMTAFPIPRSRFKGVAGDPSGGEQQQLAIARVILQQPSRNRLWALLPRSGIGSMRAFPC